MSPKRTLIRPPAPRPPKERSSIFQVLRGVLRSDFSQYTEKAYRVSVFSAPILGRRLFVPITARPLRRVLVEDFQSFPKSRVTQRLLSPLIGTSMFVTNDAHWRRQRRMVDPTLELSRLKAFLPLMQQAVDEMMARLREAEGGRVDIELETMRVAADILCRTVFSEEVPPGFVDRLAEAFRKYQVLTPRFIWLEMFGLPRWASPLHAARARRHARRIRALLSPLIEARMARMKSGTAPDDLLGALIEAEDPETGYRFTRSDLVDEVAFFFLAGHETTASALAWGFYLLARDREAQSRCQAEIDAALGTEVPGFSALRRLRFTRDCWRETMRLYPPVTTYIRDAREAQQVAGRKIAKGDLVAVTPWLVHRSTRNWSHPDLFDPDRFSTEEGRVSMRGAYIPFNTGPRVCSGAAFATQETLLVMGEVLRRYDLAPAPGPEPEPVAWLTQRARHGIWLTFQPRQKNT